MASLKQFNKLVNNHWTKTHLFRLYTLILPVDPPPFLFDNFVAYLMIARASLFWRSRKCVALHLSRALLLRLLSGRLRRGRFSSAAKAIPTPPAARSLIMASLAPANMLPL